MLMGIRGKILIFYATHEALDVMTSQKLDIPSSNVPGRPGKAGMWVRVPEGRDKAAFIATSHCIPANKNCNITTQLPTNQSISF